MNHKTTVTLSVVVLITVLTGVGTITTVIFSTPKDVGPAGVTFWFLSLLVFLTGLITMGSFILKLRKTKYREKSQKSLMASLRTAFLISFATVGLLALKSIDSLNLRDVILFTLTVVVVEFYFRTKKA